MSSRSTYLARRHEHVVTEPACNDRVVHDRLVRLVLEVRVPSRAELRAGPAVHLSELIFGWADLDPSLDTVSRKRASAVDIPLVENFLLGLLVSANEVVETLDVRLSTIGGECQVVILEVETDAGQVNERLDAGSAQLLWVTDTRPLENEGRAQSTTGHDDLLASLVDPRLLLVRGERLGRTDLDTNSPVALQEHLLALGVDYEMQVLVVCARAMDVSVSRV